MKMLGDIKRKNQELILNQRILLFCFGEKCMSGRIEEIQKPPFFNQTRIRVEFIEPNYFKNELVVGNTFAIKEASNVLAEGVVVDVV